jgi:plastocyanin
MEFFMAGSTFGIARGFRLALVLLALPLGASGAAAAGQYSVTLSQMRFGPVPANMHVGDTISFVNKDTVPHTVTARDHSFNLQIPAGKQATLRMTKAGTFSFYCVLHPAMRGTLKVS